MIGSTEKFYLTVNFSYIYFHTGRNFISTWWDFSIDRDTNVSDCAMRPKIWECLLDGGEGRKKPYWYKNSWILSRLAQGCRPSSFNWKSPVFLIFSGCTPVLRFFDQNLRFLFKNRLIWLKLDSGSAYICKFNFFLLIPVIPTDCQHWQRSNFEILKVPSLILNFLIPFFCPLILKLTYKNFVIFWGDNNDLKY